MDLVETDLNPRRGPDREYDDSFYFNHMLVSLNAAAATVSGQVIKGHSIPGYTIYSHSTGTATILIEVSDLDSGTSTDWVTRATLSPTGTVANVVVVDEPHIRMRARISAYTDGTHTVNIHPWYGKR